MLAPTPLATPFGYNIPWSRYPKDINYLNIFFDHFFPSLVGKAAVLDEYLGNMRCSCHNMVISDKIKFHAPSRPDPDYIVSVDSIVFALQIELANTIFQFDEAENLCYASNKPFSQG